MLLLRIILLTISISLSIGVARAEPNRQILIFVSCSMNDAALQNYYQEAEKIGARLIIRGLVNNSFIATQNKISKLKINIDIDPNLFEQYEVQSVPTIIYIKENEIKKIVGHIPLKSALEIMEQT